MTDAALRPRDARARVEATLAAAVRHPFGLWVGFVLVVTLAPHIGILLMSFSKVWSFSVLPDSYTLEHYVTIFTDSKLMVVNTLKYCLMRRYGGTAAR